MLEARAHAHDFGSGHLRPQLFFCDHDGQRERWVLKLMGNANGELAADWIGCLLAQRLGLRTPEVEIANVSEAAIETVRGSVPWAQAGPAFASKYVEVTPVDSWQEMEGKIEPAEMARLVVLDVWLDVVDRQRPEGGWNMFLEKSTERAMVHDFGKGLTPCIYILLGGVAQSQPHPALVHLGATRLLDDACSRVEALDNGEIEEIVSSVPEPWITDAARSCILEFLKGRKNRLRELCMPLSGGRGA